MPEAMPHPTLHSGKVPLGNPCNFDTVDNHALPGMSRQANIQLVFTPLSFLNFCRLELHP